MDIISAYQQLGSYRAAAEQCGTTHRTVKKVVDKFEADQAGLPPRPRSERAHNYDVVADLVAERVEKSKGRISAKRLLPIARAAGYEGSARNFRRLVADAKALWRSVNHRGRRPAVWEPGQYLVIDWAQAAPGLFLFCAVLAFSRWRFVRFATDQRASTTLALIAEALAAAGGVPAKVLADRMACLKGGVVANVVVPTPDYVRLASYYGFAPDFCHASDPQSKGIVENLCGYAQDDLAVPLLTEAALTGKPIPVRDANAAAVTWCAEVNAATHSEIQAISDERLIVERGLLQPLPSLKLQIGAPSALRKVDRLSCVRYGSARYSVPTRLIGTTVTVVVEHGCVCLLEPATGVIVAEHELVAPGAVSILDDHYDGPRPAPSRGPRPRTTVEKQFCDLGADAQAFLVGAAAIGNTRLGSELEILLALGAAQDFSLTTYRAGAREIAVAEARAREFGRQLRSCIEELLELDKQLADRIRAVTEGVATLEFVTETDEHSGRDATIQTVDNRVVKQAPPQPPPPDPTPGRLPPVSGADDVRRVLEPLQNGGRRGPNGVGSKPTVKEIWDETSTKRLWDYLTRQASEGAPPSDYKGSIRVLPDGTRIGFRRSDNWGDTIDVWYPDPGYIKTHTPYEPYFPSLISAPPQLPPTFGIPSVQIAPPQLSHPPTTPPPAGIFEPNGLPPWLQNPSTPGLHSPVQPPTLMPGVAMPDITQPPAPAPDDGPSLPVMSDAVVDAGQAVGSVIVGGAVIIGGLLGTVTDPTGQLAH